MTSGEWDLRALEALEAEEEKEFLRLSQTDLLEPPPPPAASAAGQQQLHPLLLLPTINEYKRNAAAAPATAAATATAPTAAAATTTHRLKFTRALSLSAHSLKRMTPTPTSSSTIVLAKPAPENSSKSFGSLSPPPKYNASPLYTPPPVRRCATLHHSVSAPLRKHYKQLLRQEALKADGRSPQLQRIGGTNKTYWKYGANSTAASIVGETRRLKRVAAAATKTVIKTTATASVAAINNNNNNHNNSKRDTEYLGGEVGAGAAIAVVGGMNSNHSCNNNNNNNTSSSTNNSSNNSEDSAPENGSCSVPLASDSIEMMRFMLNAATSAVNCEFPSTMATPSSPPPEMAATGGGGEVRRSSVHSHNTIRFSSLTPYSLKLSATCDAMPPNETVAYEAFQQTANNRRKSFSGTAAVAGGGLLRDHLNRINKSQRENNNIAAATSVKSGNMLLTATNATQLNHMTKALTKCNDDDEDNNKVLGCQRTLLVRSVSGYRELAAHPVSATHEAICYGSPVFDDDLQQHIEHCDCSCNHFGYGNSMDYRTTGFGGGGNCSGGSLSGGLLPDVTEHSNIRRNLSRQNSNNSNSESGAEISSIQSKMKGTFSVDVKSSATLPTIRMAMAAAAAAATTPTSLTMPPSSTLTALSAAGTVLQRKKYKSAQNDNDANAAAASTERDYKARRATCIFGLTLLLALVLLAVAAALVAQHFFMAPSRNSHAQRLRIVRRVLQEVPLVDGHNNFAWNVRKYAHSSLELVHLSHDLDHKTLWSRPTWAQTDMERLKQGLMGVQVWSAFVPCEAQGLDAVQLALEQIDIIRRFTELYAQDTLLVTTSKDIGAARRRGLMASLIGIEGGHAIGSSLGVLRSFYSLGARYLSLTHKCDVSWAGSSASATEVGLTTFGKAIIREMNRLGMMIDLSYSSDATARDVLQATRAPVIFSHSAARQLCNSSRNIPDDILRLVAENGGLIMISFDSEDVACGRQARLADVVDHINYVRSIAGIQHIGLGAGYDGIDQPPVGLEDVSKYPDLLATLLEDHNWSEEDVAMLAGKNFMRIMETVENVRDYWKRAAIQPVEQTEPQPKTQCTYMSS